MATWYQQWFNSPYYHKLYFQRDEAEARAAIHRLLQRLQPAPGSRMLDAACGRGRHSNILSAAGYDVAGIDLSPESIAFAKQFETATLHFYLHDLRLPFWMNYFDYAFNFFTSFGYFATRREHDAALRTICQSLKPGGFFLLDYLSVSYAETHLRASETVQIDETVFDIRRWHDAGHFYKHISISDPELKQPLAFTEKVAKFHLDDFTAMLTQQHMQVTDVFGDYQLGPYDAHKTPHLIVLAKRIANP